MTFLKVMHDTKNQIINLCATLPLNLGLVPGLYYAITSIIYVSNNQQGILKVMHYTKDQLIDRCTRPPLIKWYLFPGYLRPRAEITRSCNSSIAVAFGHNELWRTPAVNSLFVVSQMLWPLATMNSGVLWPQIAFLWPLKCCVLWPQRTVAAYCCESKLCQDKQSLIWVSNKRYRGLQLGR